jgi:hypothetical protein
MSYYDNRNLSLVGWDKTSASSQNYQYFFSQENIDRLSAQITEHLKTTGQTIKVSDRVIGGVMSDVSRSFNPRTGDIFSRYIIPTEEGRDDLKNMNDQVITVIVNTVREEIEQQRCNERLSIWTTVLGDFNPEGMRAHSKIKTRERDYMKGEFMMNY